MLRPGSSLRAQPAVDHLQDPVAVVQDVVVVGDQDVGDAPFVALPGEQRDDVLAAPAVQRGGGLVHQQHAGVVDQRPRDAHPLALVAGHLAGAMRRAVTHVDVVEQLGRVEVPGAAASVGDPVGQLKLVGGGQRGDEVAGLRAAFLMLSGMCVPLLKDVCDEVTRLRARHDEG